MTSYKRTANDPWNWIDYAHGGSVIEVAIGRGFKSIQFNVPMPPVPA